MNALTGALPKTSSAMTSRQSLKWGGHRNVGELLARAEQAFDVFITVDRDLSFQQNLPEFGIAVIVLRAPTNRLADLCSLVPKLIESLPQAKHGEVLCKRLGNGMVSARETIG